MSVTIEAIYEAGILKPLTPLSFLKENAKVRVTVEPAEKPVPTVRRAKHPVDLSREREWVLAHRDEYRGQWIVLDGDRLVGHSANPDQVDAFVEQARQQGVRSPYIELIPLDDEPIWAGLL